MPNPKKMVITEWDGTEETVEVLEGPVSKVDLGGDSARILYNDGVCHEVSKDYLLSKLRAVVLH